MVKLADNEIQEKLEEENGSSEVLDVPSGAWSKFRFRIEENIEDLVTLITEMPKKEIAYKRVYKNGDVFEDKCKAPWETSVAEKEDGSVEYQLSNIFAHPDFPSIAEVNVSADGDEMVIKTASAGDVYTIKQDERGGCVIEFDGPLLALLDERLLPPMTYVPGTLNGKFVKDGEDLTDYMLIDEYLSIDNKRSTKDLDWEYDGYVFEHAFGMTSNAKFNNEIFGPENEEKLIVFVDEFLAEVKGEKREAIQKQVEKYKEDKGNSVVSPEVGAEIKQRMMEEMQNKR